MTRLVPILRCVKNRASRDVSGADVAKSSPTDSQRFPRERLLAHFLLILFFILRFALWSLCRPISKHATRNAQHDGGGPEVLGINVKLIIMYSYYHYCSVSSRNYNLMKIVTRRQLNGLGSLRLGLSLGSGPRVAGNISCPRRAILGHASCATFFHGAPKLRELKEREGGYWGRGPTAGVLTAAVHDEVSRSRFLEKRVSSRSVREERASSSRVSRRTVMERRSGRTQP